MISKEAKDRVLRLIAASTDQSAAPRPLSGTKPCAQPRVPESAQGRGPTCALASADACPHAQALARTHARTHTLTHQGAEGPRWHSMGAACW